MSQEILTTDELVRLVQRVFRPGPGDRTIAVLCDLPDDARPDHPEWVERRAMAQDWANLLRQGLGDLDMSAADLITFRNARRNNADLPATAWVHEGGPVPDHADRATGREMPMAEVLSTYRILLAPTELSATAPLKLAGPDHGFRAATMGGFKPGMVPALRLDWPEIDTRCRALKDKLDAADGAAIRMRAGGIDHDLHLDLRHRTATASGGMLVEPGKAGNLPSGETYIVPYEGEVDGDPSRTAGTLPIEMDGEAMVLEIEANRVRGIVGSGPIAARERAEFAAEPAYANVAELGLGLLRGYGIKPVGTILLDEKLGLHIAFGRSDHFGGQVGADDFSSPDKVVHIDRVYIPEVQPGVEVAAVDLIAPDGTATPLMRDGDYV